MNEIDLRRFDLNLLIVFEVLMTERSVSRAAERLGRTQSAVSHSLSRLRSQLGDPLLIKGGVRMQPTAVAHQAVGALEWRCFGRKNHPAFAKWNRQAWTRWPHLVVRVGDTITRSVNV